MINPRTLWATGYVAANSAAFAIILSEHELLGDLAGFDAPPWPALLATLALVTASIYGLQGFLSVLARIRLPSVPVRIPARQVGIAMALLQLSFIAYVAVTHQFVAGSTERGGSLMSALWVTLLNVDTLFFVYYATCRDSPAFKYNLVLWAISFMQRGWFAYIFFILAVESFRLIRAGRLRPRLLLFVAPLIVVYPLLDLVKVYIRVSDNVSVSDAAAIVSDELAGSEFSWLDTIQLAGEKIVGRVQVLSHAQVIADNDAYFSRLPPSELSPFWEEGMVGIIFDRLTGQEHGPEAAQALATFIAPGFDSSWNVNPSLVGWLTMHEDDLPFALLYLALLCVLSAWLTARLNHSTAAFDTLWFIWLTLLIPGWVAQFVSFILAQLTFYLFVRAISSLRAGRVPAEPAKIPLDPLVDVQ